MISIATNGQAYYSVSAQTDAAWHALLSTIAREIGVSFQFLSYPLPQSLEELWLRQDLNCVFVMCGYPIALREFVVVPIASPVPAVPWAQGRAVYRTDLVVKTDSSHENLGDTFGGRIGWTTRHSHSGFNALRYHLLQYRTPERPRLYAEVVGNLGTVRGVFDAVLDGTIDVGPIDAYWHMLMRCHHPELAAGVRVIESTATAPMPAFVASPVVPRPVVDQLLSAFQSLGGRPGFRPIADALLIDGFLPVRGVEAFDVILARTRQAEDLQYWSPA